MKPMTMLCSLAVVWSTLLCAQVPSQPEGLGRVTGTVLNEEGQPIAKASVCVAALRTNMMTHCNTLTDQAGHFEVEHLAMGRFLVSAVKEEDGYSPQPRSREQSRSHLTRADRKRHYKARSEGGDVPLASSSVKHRSLLSP